MGFNDQLQNLAANSGNQFSMFQQGVKVKWMGGKTLGPNGIVNFRILPAHNPQDLMPDGSVNPAGWLPSRAPSGDFTDWGFMIETCRFVGHKDFKMDFLSPSGIDPDRTFILDYLYNVCAGNQDWNYIIKREKTSRVPPIMTRPQQILMMNVLLVDGGMQEVNLAGFTRRSIDALIGQGSGLLNQTVEMDAEMLAKNYTLQWRARDITNPTEGYVIQLKKAADNTFSADFQSINGQVRKLPLDSSLLVSRYPIYDWKSLLNLKTDEQMIADLLRIFNKRNANGLHEYHMLKEAFEPLGHTIPNPPSAPAAGTTVQAGFQKPAEAAPAPATSPGVYTPPETTAAPVATPETSAAPVATPETSAAPVATPETSAAPVTVPETQATPETPATQPVVAQAAAKSTPTVPGDNVAPAGGDKSWMDDFLQDLKA